MKKWFDINIKKPKDKQEVIVTFFVDTSQEGIKQGPCYMLATYFEDKFYTFETTKVVPNVSHWMSLPKAPL